MTSSPWTVVDTQDVQPGHTCPVVGTFATEAAAVVFIPSLPDYESGRYQIDGPAEDSDLIDMSDVIEISVSISGDTLRAKLKEGGLQRQKANGFKPGLDNGEAAVAAVEYAMGFMAALAAIGGDDLANKVSGQVFLAAVRGPEALKL